MAKFAPATAANLVDKIMAWEGDGIDYDTPEEYDFFQYLINTGQCWTLQGCYGRRATQLIESGKCHRPKHK